MDIEKKISENDCLDLIKLARSVIELRLSKIASFNQLLESQISFPQKRGAFVTIYKNDAIHGCMGTPWPAKSVSETVKEAAVKSAFEDPRVPPLEETDLNTFKIELSLVSIPKITLPDQIKIGLHGLIVHNENASGLLLPHIPIEYGWNVNAFLAGTSIKAGLPIDGWKYSEIYTFEVQTYRER